MYPVKHIWTILMLKILQAHLLQAFFANLKIDAIYALYPEIFGDINLAVQEVFAFSDYTSNAVSNLGPCPYCPNFSSKSMMPVKEELTLCLVSQF